MLLVRMLIENKPRKKGATLSYLYVPNPTKKRTSPPNNRKREYSKVREVKGMMNAKSRKVKPEAMKCKHR